MNQPPPVDQLVEQFIASRIELLLEPETVTWYGHILRPWAAAMPPYPQPASIQAYLTRAPRLSTARTWLRAIRALYNWSEKPPRNWPNIARNVTTPGGRKKMLPRVFSNAELALIYREAQRDPLDHAAVAVLIDTGMRIGELASLRTEHIDDEGVLVDGKTGQHRVPMTPTARRAVMRIAPPTGPVFRSQRGQRRPLTCHSLKLRIRRLFKRAGLSGPKLGPHTLRHTFATHYLRNGGDIHRLQRILGHSRIQQTMEYLHLADPDAFSEHNRLSPLRTLQSHQEGLWDQQRPTA